MTIDNTALTGSPPAGPTPEPALRGDRMINLPRSPKVIAGLVILALFGLFAIWLPPAPEFKNQQAFETIFGVVPRNVAGSLLAYWAGDFANSFTIAKMKLWTNGRYLWTRTVGSTIVGQAVDTSIVIFFIFWGQPLSVIFGLILGGYLFKVTYEVLATPLTYWVVNSLKRTEGVNYFDRGTDFNPFAEILTEPRP